MYLLLSFESNLMVFHSRGRCSSVTEMFDATSSMQFFFMFCPRLFWCITLETRDGDEQHVDWGVQRSPSNMLIGEYKGPGPESSQLYGTVCLLYNTPWGQLCCSKVYIGFWLSYPISSDSPKIRWIRRYKLVCLAFFCIWGCNTEVFQIVSSLIACLLIGQRLTGGIK